MRSITTALVIVLIGLLAGCKATPPQVTGKWHGTGQLDASYTTAMSPNTPRHQIVLADFTLVLAQNGTIVQGDASVTAMKAPPIHMTITTGSLAPGGKLYLEGERASAFSNVHFSFEGKVGAGKITGTLAIELNNAGQRVENRGAISLEPTT